MNISFNWLNEYINLQDYTPDDLADKLTMAGIEVEDIKGTGTDIPEGVIVAEILERKPHPDAEKLSICRVNTGSEELQIVCGADNCDAGVKVPLATVGTVFLDNGKKFKIKKSKLRGVESMGMLCSGKELAIDNNHDGIMHLATNAVVGKSLKNQLESDTVYEVEITPNRPDWLSHWGVARDLSALIKQPAKLPAIPELTPDYLEDTDNLVTVKDFGLCPRYTARIIRGVKITESPEWMKKHLISIGMRPINNVVDITNYVMMELGHPMHAFDLKYLEGEKIIVRRAEKGEKIITLDGEEHELDNSNLVICDAKKPVALAGIMGGEHSGVEENTVDILLESAVFQTSNIRATSKKLKIASDSSFRFERGVDWEMCETASNRATALILELAGGKLKTELVDLKTKPPEIPVTKCRFEKIRSILGVNIPNKEITDIFTGLGLEVNEIDKEKAVVTSTSYRLDVFREADLAEEVARIHGIDKLPPMEAKAQSGGSLYEDSYIRLETVSNELISLGLNSCMNYSLIHKDRALTDARFAEADLKKLKNPISLELACLRPSLFAQMLETVERNVARQNHNLALFELGRVYCANPAIFPEERLECVIALTGCKHPERYSDEKQNLYDFFDLKGLLEAWMDIRKENCEFRKLSDERSKNNFKSGNAAELIIGNQSVAMFGEVAPKLTKGMRLNAPLFVALIKLDKFCKQQQDENADGSKQVKLKPIPPYPSTTRDVAFIADSGLENAEIVETIAQAKVKNLEKIELFDIFEDEKAIGKNKKSMAYSLTFRNSERTLTDKEVNKAHEKLRNFLASKLSVELR